MTLQKSYGVEYIDEERAFNTIEQVDEYEAALRDGGWKITYSATCSTHDALGGPYIILFLQAYR